MRSNPDPDSFYDLCDEIDRLYDWAIATHPVDGHIAKSERTRQKIQQVASYWMPKLDAIMERVKAAREDLSFNDSAQ